MYISEHKFATYFEAVFSKGLDPISLIRSTLVPLLALGSNFQGRYILYLLV